MFNESRPLRLFADNAEIAKDNRIRVQGRSNMTLLPDFFLVDIYNLSAEDAATLRISKRLTVYANIRSGLCSGEVEEIYTHDEDSNTITTVSISDGLSFWASSTRTSIAGGAYARDVLKTIVTGVELGAVACEDYRLPRGQTFCGRTAFIVSNIARSLTARAYITKGVLNVVGERQVVNVLQIKDSDIIASPRHTKDALILKVDVKGYSVGDVVEYGGSTYRLIVQAVNADNFSGPWETELTLIGETGFSGDGIGGGW